MEYQERLNDGLARLGAGDAAGAVEPLASCVAEQPDDPAALLYLAIARATLGETATAEGLLERARAVAPYDPKIAFNLARLHHRAGDHARAAPLYRETLRLNPGHEQARESLARLEVTAPVAVPAAPVERPEPRGWLAGDVACRRIEVISAARVGGLIGLGIGLIVGLPIAAAVAFPVAAAGNLGVGLAAGAVCYLFVPLLCGLGAALGGLLYGALYNLLVGWLGPVIAVLEADGAALRVVRVEPFSYAKIITGIQAVLSIGQVALQMPLMALGGLTSGGGPAMLFGSLAAFAGMMVGSMVLGIGVNLVVNLLSALLYNWATRYTGGLRCWVDADGDEVAIGRLDVGSLVSTLVVAVLPAAAVAALVAAPIAGLLTSVVAGLATLVGVLVGLPLLTALQYGLGGWLYNLVSRRGGGLELVLEEE